MTCPASDRGSASLTLAAGAAVLLLIIILLGAVAGIGGQQAGAACQAPPAASTAASSIPATYLAGYQKAGARYGIPWTVLAGIGTVESDNGQSDLPGVHSGTNPYGAAGPMQFGTGGAAGNTWGGAPVHPASEHTGGYGIDGDRDGIVNVYDPGDAIPSAAYFLQAHGAPADLQAALLAFNHSAAYVSDILSWAARYSAGGAQAVSAAGSPQGQLAAAGPLPAGTAGTIIAYAEAQLGKPYLFGGTGPDAFDCSGLAMMAYRAAQITTPRTSQAQWAYGTQIPASQVRPGDLVFFAGADGTPASPGHVGIVLDPAARTMIDAYETGYPVEEDTYGLPASKGGLSPVVGFTRPVGSQ
jgi:cell wall-associated NlpC family hydrolase